jgi:hypothetical protein
VYGLGTVGLVLIEDAKEKEEKTRVIDRLTSTRSMVGWGDKHTRVGVWSLRRRVLSSTPKRRIVEGWDGRGNGTMHDR